MLLTLLAVMCALTMMRIVSCVAKFAVCRMQDIKVYDLRLFSGPSISRASAETTYHLGLVPLGASVSYEKRPGFKAALVPAAGTFAGIGFIYAGLTAYWHHRDWGWLTPEGFGEYIVALLTGVYALVTTLEVPAAVERWIEHPTPGFAVFGLLSIALLDRLTELTPLGHTGRKLLVGAFESLTGRTAWSWIDTFGQRLQRNWTYSFLGMGPLAPILLPVMVIIWTLRFMSFMIRMSGEDWEAVRRPSYVLRD